MQLQIKSRGNSALNAKLKDTLKLTKTSDLSDNNIKDHSGNVEQDEDYVTYEVNTGDLDPLLDIIGNDNKIILDNGSHITFKQYKEHALQGNKENMIWVMGDD